MDIETAPTSQLAPTPMVVDGPFPPDETCDYYTASQHIMMDKEVEAILTEEDILWEENPSHPVICFVLQAVVWCDLKLDRKFLEPQNFPDELGPMLSDAWKAMSFRSLRICCRLHATPAPEPIVIDRSVSLTEKLDHYTAQEHDRMDREVGEKLERAGLLWRQHRARLTKLELRFVFLKVVEGDVRLDRKFLQDNIFPDNLYMTLNDAWQAISFQSVRILRSLLVPEQLASVREAMNHPYKGKSVTAFVRYLERNNTMFNSHDNTYYAKFCSILQSSGTGKTRLLLELGKDVCVLYINIRRQEDGKYPPRDDIPANLLTEVLPTEELYHQRCQLFFTAVFKHIAIILRRGSPLGMSDVNDRLGRTRFFEDVQKEFANIGREYQYPLRSAMLRYFKEMVNCFARENDDAPKVVIALDEADVLHRKSQGQQYLPTTVLLQTIKEYSDEYKSEPVWVVFASTISNIAHFAPPQALCPSARVALEGELLFPPFTLLGWDRHAPKINKVALDKVAWASHIIQYGRPLWWSLKGHTSLPKIVDLAAQKLCARRTFDPDNPHHAFAILGQRFGLDIAFGHRHAVQHNDASVASHLRICIQTTDDRIWSYTTYPAEPILSAAAADLLYENEQNLTKALNSVSSMINDGLINIGDAGELASRFLWLLVKDLCIRQGLGWRSPTPLTNHGMQSDYELPHCRPVPLVEFLELLFGPHLWIKASNARKIFRDAYINFSHWVQMGLNITRGKGGCNNVSIEAWLESLWARTSAVQCCHNQPQIDKVIPVYFMSKPRGSRMSHILISDKARDLPQKELLGEITRKHWSIAPHHSGPPYIAIVADLGVPSSGLVVVDETNKKDPCLRIHAIGLDKKTYPFLEEGITQTLRDLYARQSIPSGPGLAEDILNEVRFGWSREARYMNQGSD